MFYNVSYATNVALRDPFTPEKGAVQPLRRFVRNLTDLPASLGDEARHLRQRGLDVGLVL